MHVDPPDINAVVGHEGAAQRRQRGQLLHGRALAHAHMELYPNAVFVEIRHKRAPGVPGRPEARLKQLHHCASFGDQEMGAHGGRREQEVALVDKLRRALVVRAVNEDG